MLRFVGGPELAKNHGVFVSSRKEPEKLDFMLQKPSVEEMGQLMQDYLFLMDIGIWLLSDRAIELMVKRSTDKDGGVKFYDMYWSSTGTGSASAHRG